MNQRFEMEDKDGRYVTAEFDSITGSFRVTSYLTLKLDVSVDEVLSESGYKVLSKKNVEKPQVVGLFERRLEE